MRWQADSACAGENPDLFYDSYENDPVVRKVIDSLCMSCPVQKECFSTGVSNNDWGVWGGVYLTEGQISDEFNNHKTNEDWADLWTQLTMERDVY